MTDNDFATFQEFEAILHRGGNWGYYWTDKGTLSQWWEAGKPAVIPRSWQNVYFGVHPNDHQGGVYERSKTATVAAINCLFSEFDNKDFGGDPGRCHGHILDLTPTPNVIIQSGGGYHAYWLIPEPFILNSESDRERAQKLQAAWVTYTQGDNGAKDLARVLRVPGSLNHKYTPPRQVAFVLCNLDTCYQLDDLVDFMRQDAQPEPTPAFTQNNGKASNVQRVAHLDSDGAKWLDEAIAKAHIGNRNDCGFELAIQLRDDGLSIDQAKDIMRQYARAVPKARGNPYTPSMAEKSAMSAYSQPPREPAKSLSNTQRVAGLNPETSSRGGAGEAVTGPHSPQVSHGEPGNGQAPPMPVFSSGLDILQAKFEPAIQIIPDVFPAGMGILAGRAKRGKTTIIYQACQSICTPGGGKFLERKVLPGKVLYISLEEWPEAIQERMKDQGWTKEQAQNITIVTIDDFRKTFGFLQFKGAAGRLCEFVASNNYRLVVIDTFAKAFLGLRDQDKSEVVTQALTPLHQLANTLNFGCLFIDHHGHDRGLDPDPVNDIMSSSAKAQIADTVIGFYSDGPGKRKLKIIGRRVPEQDISLTWDGLTRCYQRIQTDDDEQDLTGRQLKAKRWLRDNQPASLSQIATGTGIAASNLSPIMRLLLQNGHVALNEQTREYSCV